MPKKRLTKKSDEYLEKCFAAIRASRAVEHVIIMSKTGLPIKSTMDTATTLTYVGLYGPVATKAAATIAEMDPKEPSPAPVDALKHVRIKSKYNEIFITIDDDITFVVIQKI